MYGPPPAHLSGCAGVLQAEVVAQLMEDCIRTGAIATLGGGEEGRGLDNVDQKVHTVRTCVAHMLVPPPGRSCWRHLPIHTWTHIHTLFHTYLQPSVAAAAAADRGQARPPARPHEGQDDNVALVLGEVNAFL